MRLSLSLITCAIGLIAASPVSTPAAAQGTIKIGIIGQMTGPFATMGQGYRQGIDAFFAKYGTTVAGKKIEVIYRDSAGSDATVAKRLTEELVVRDRVSFLGGYPFTPEAASSAPVITEAKVPTFLFSASTPTLTAMSPYFVRTGNSMLPSSELSAIYARRLGKTRGYSAVADYAPGHVVEESFANRFKTLGGQIVRQDRIPLNTTDFSPFAERISNANPDALFLFVPPGATGVGMMKALGARGLIQKMLVMGQAEAEDNDLHLFDDSILGHHSISYVAMSLENEETKALKAFLLQKYGANAAVDVFNVGAYDAMHMIYKIIEAKGGNVSDADADIKTILNTSLESPRGPITLGQDRELIQNYYVRQVRKDADGRKRNVIIDTFREVSPQGVPKS